MWAVCPSAGCLPERRWDAWRMEGGNPDHPGEEGNWEVEGGGTPWDRIVTIAGEERVSRRQCVQLCHLLLGGGARRAVKNTPFLPLFLFGPCHAVCGILVP